MASTYLPEVDYHDPSSPGAFTATLLRTGFAVVRHHPIDRDLIVRIEAEWLAFFDSVAKQRYMFDRARFDGYFPATVSETAKTGAVRDLKEYFHLYPWGRYPAEVSDAARLYYAAASALAAEILDWVEVHTPPAVRARFSVPLSSMIKDSPRTMLRILRYPPLTGDELPDALRAAAHEDINLLTLLPAASEHGLQVLDRTGNWHAVPADPEAMIVNVGDMLQEASGGYYRSTTHRVVNPTGEARLRSRISMPLFLHPRPETVLSTRYTAQSYLDERIAELMRQA
jgi:isopenicillin N synthase-like dioxygenase